MGHDFHCLLAAQRTLAQLERKKVGLRTQALQNEKEFVPERTISLTIISVYIYLVQLGYWSRFLNPRAIFA